MAIDTLQTHFNVRKTAIPSSSSIETLYDPADLHDAFEVDLPDDAANDPEPLARHLHAHPAPWFGTLIRLRDAIVAPFGIKTTRQFESEAVDAAHDRIAFFRIFERHPNEIVFGQDDQHLDFRASVLVLPVDAGHPRRRVVAVTVVHCHNLLGKTYLAIIAPFHRRVVIGALRQASKAGWPAPGSAS